MARTPGPWFWVTDKIVTSEAGQDWASHIVADAQTAEDARLIAAAPELLEACEHIYEVIKWSASIDDKDKRMLRSAIARAKGEQHGTHLS
jgi:hypothetical protein